jgi:branched-chain amino acid transport system substrate-binding protein
MITINKKHQTIHLMISLGICLVLILGTAGCGGGKKSKGVVKIGVIAPLTGTASADGQEMVRGAELAVEEINAAGGILGYTFEVLQGDTKDQIPDAVTSAIQRITADSDVHMMMTGYACGSNFEIETMAQMKMPYIVAANSDSTYGIISPNPDAFPTVWSLTPSFLGYQTELPRMMEKWAEEGKITLNNRKVAIVASDNGYSKPIAEGLRDNFTELGWTVTVYEMVPFGEVLDWRTILGKIRQDPPDLIINTDYLPGNDATFLIQFLEDPTDSYLFMQYGPSVPEFYDLTSDQSTGVLYNMLGGVIRAPGNEVANKFFKLYKDKYSVDSGDYGYFLYNAVYIYIEALKIVGDPTDHLAIGKAIGGLEMDNAAGHLKFDPATHLALQGDDYYPIQFYQLRDGERILITPEEYSTGDIQVAPWIGTP